MNIIVGSPAEAGGLLSVSRCSQTSRHVLLVTAVSGFLSSLLHHSPIKFPEATFPPLGHSARLLCGVRRLPFLSDVSCSSESFRGTVYADEVGLFFSNRTAAPPGRLNSCLKIDAPSPKEIAAFFASLERGLPYGAIRRNSR